MAIKYEDGRIEHAGQVVFGPVQRMHFSTPGMGDNSQYMIVLDPATNDYKQVLVSVYHDGLYDRVAEAEVDAPVELRRQYEAKMEYERLLLAEMKRVDAEEREKTEVRKDKRIRVISGRAITPGTEGTAFWVGQTKYGQRVGFTSDAGETLWTNLVNVRVI